MKVNYSTNRILTLLFLLSAAVLWPWLRWYVNNPDSFQYLQIANHYHAGRWSEAINGYWSPLVSWLLAPFLETGLRSVELFKILQLLIAVVALNAWIRLTDRAVSNRKLSLLIQIAAIPVLLSHALLYLTPDLLFTTLLLLLLDYFIFRPVWHDRKRSLLAACLGASLYFAKAFGLPLFLIFVAGSVFYHRRAGNPVRFGNLFASIGLFFLIGGSWIGLISIKYGHFTVSEAARFNVTEQVSPRPGQIVLLPILYTEGLHAPSGSHALSAWEEPLQALSADANGTWRLIGGRERFTELVSRNLQSIWFMDFRRQTGFFFLLLLLHFLFFGRKELLTSPQFVYPALVLLAVYSGYSLILFHARYSWICIWSMVFLSAVMVNGMQDTFGSVAGRVRLLLFVVLVLLAVKRPIKELLYSADKDVTAAEFFHSVFHFPETLESTYRDDSQVALDAERLKSLDGPLASRFTAKNDRNRYFSSLAVAQQCGQPYLGQFADGRPGSIDTLRMSDVKYFLIWDDTLTRWNGRVPLYSSALLKVFPVR